MSTSTSSITIGCYAPSKAATMRTRWWTGGPNGWCPSPAASCWPAWLACRSCSSFLSQPLLGCRPLEIAETCWNYFTKAVTYVLLPMSCSSFNSKWIANCKFRVQQRQTVPLQRFLTNSGCLQGQLPTGIPLRGRRHHGGRLCSGLLCPHLAAHLGFEAFWRQKRGQRWTIRMTLMILHDFHWFSYVSLLLVWCSRFVEIDFESWQIEASIIFKPWCVRSIGW